MMPCIGKKKMAMHKNRFKYIVFEAIGCCVIFFMVFIAKWNAIL